MLITLVKLFLLVCLYTFSTLCGGGVQAMTNAESFMHIVPSRLVKEVSSHLRLLFFH